MGQRRYGQYCGIAHAADLVAERWTLLIIRDLLVGPKRFTDLRKGLPGIPTNILSTRLKRLETTGVVSRRVLPRPASAVVYELTDYGRDLENVLLALGRWGARALGEPRPGEIVTTDALVIALRATFQPEEAEHIDLTVELHVGGAVVTAEIDGRTLMVTEGEAAPADAAPDLVVHAGPSFRALLAGEISAEDAIGEGHVRIEGDSSALGVFGTVFRIGILPAVGPVVVPDDNVV